MGGKCYAGEVDLGDLLGGCRRSLAGQVLPITVIIDVREVLGQLLDHGVIDAGIQAGVRETANPVETRRADDAIVVLFGQQGTVREIGLVLLGLRQGLAGECRDQVGRHPQTDQSDVVKRGAGCHDF